MSDDIIQHPGQTCGQCEASDSYRKVELPRPLYDEAANGGLIEMDSVAICVECGGVF